MSVRSFVVIVLTLHAVSAQKGSSCITPNNETATCVEVRSCKVITDAILTEDQGAKDFAKESQCGHDKEPLVCCGSTAYFKLPDLFSEIFTKPPEEFDPFGIFERPPKDTIESSHPDQTTIASVLPNGLPDRTVCGLDSAQSRITGGETTDIDEFPWMAALEFKSIRTGQSAGIRCGGTIINNRHVLTAAHCIISNEFELVSVWLGEYRLSTDPDCDTVQTFTTCTDKVQKVKTELNIPHPFYSARSGDNDIALLKLERDIEYTSFIRPICLPQSNFPPPEHGTNLTVAGWGATENGTTSDFKLKVSVPLLSNANCIAKLSQNRKASANQLCAGGDEGKDSCRGDSGGPLMRIYQDQIMQQVQWYQEGVVSSGVGCGRVGFPAIYTRVSRYISWIINNIKTKNPTE